jgi:restriction endonuclease Mrr
LGGAWLGVLVTTGRFESGAVEMAERDPRIELLGRKNLLQMLNEHCKGDWFTRIDRLIACIKQKNS